MSKTKHAHHLALRVKPRPALQEVWCPGCGATMYTVEPAVAVEVQILDGSLVAVYGGKARRATEKPRKFA